VKRVQPNLKKSRQRGVSLVEVLITIAILALGLIVAARTLKTAALGQSTETGIAIAALTPLSNEATIGDGAQRPPARGDEARRARDPAAERCSGFFSCVWEKATSGPLGAADLWWDYVFEIGRGAVNDVVGIWDLVTDPGSVIDAAKYVWNNPLDAARQLVWDDDSAKMWAEGNYTGAIRRTVWNVGSWAIPGVNVGRAASVLGKLGRVASKVDAPKAPDAPNQPDPVAGRNPRNDNAPDDDCSDGVCRGRQCFAPGTLVHAERGFVAIEQLQVGERVWSRDEASGAVSLQPIARTMATPDRPVLELQLELADRAEPELLTVTAEHPFWSTHGWTAAQDLQHGTSVMLRSGGWARVKGGASLDERVTVYNVEVSAAHTYFVGELGVWVHNDCEQERLDNFRRQVDPREIVGAPPGPNGSPAGHAMSKHGVSTAKQAEILNKPERIFSGRNYNGRDVDIYYQNGSVVITEAGKKHSVITAYGRVATKNGNSPVDPAKWANDPDYVELEVDGQYRVTYPDRGSWDANNWPPR